MKRLVHIIAIAVLVAVQLWSCSQDNFIGESYGNEPPSIWLASAPPEGTIAAYTLHIWWGGWDPDGEISYYEYVITDNKSGVFDPADTTSTAGDYKWHKVNANDSTFLFTADQIPDSSAIDFDGNTAGGGTHQPEEFRRSHTFFIRAVDELGARSKVPAYRSFTSRTLSPTVYVLIPPESALNPSRVPPTTTFKWSAKDYINNTLEVVDPESVRTILVPTAEHNDSYDETLKYIQKNPGSPPWEKWRYYGAPDDSGKQWTSNPLDFGAYYFAVQVKDEAGAISPVLDLTKNLRRILVSTRSTGPLFTVTNRFIGSILTSSPNTPPTILDLPAGVQLEFTLSATAESYGGIVSGYRYGWDILDLNDDSQWEIDLTPFLGGEDSKAKSKPRTFFFGSHSFFAEVVDNSGYASRVEVKVNIIPFTFTKPVLLVDDWQESSGGWLQTNGGLPSDFEHDQFWNNMLDQVDGFDPLTDVIELGTGGQNELPIQTMAPYKTIIWVANGSPSAQSGSHLLDLIHFIDPTIPQSGGKSQPPLIGLFMSAGGRVMLAGELTMTMSINRTSFGQSPIRYPIIFRYELGGDQDGKYTPPLQEVGVRGVGDNSFAYEDCCLNVLDLSYVNSGLQIRRPPEQALPPGTGCPVNQIRTNNRVQDGMVTALPLAGGGGFPKLNLRPEAAAPGKVYSTSALVCDIYNPRYFATETPCRTLTEHIPKRPCFTPIWGNGCRNTTSKIYNQPVAFWTSTYQNRIPDVGGVPARSIILGFHPVFFNPVEFKQAMDIVLFNEWQLPQK